MELIASDLKLQLDKLNALLSAKGLVEGANKFSFDEEGIYAFNGEVFIATIFPTDLYGAVEGDIFNKLINKLGANKIDIVKENEELVIKKGRSESRMAFDTDIKCPIDLSVNKWKSLPEDFIEAINVCSYTTGSDYTDMRTVCIHLKGDVCEASDVFRITIFKMKSAIKDELFIPNDILPFFNKSKPIKYCVVDNWTYFEDLDGTIIAHRQPTFEGKYPNLQEKISSLKDFHLVELPEKLYESLDKASIFLDGKFEGDKFVSITCNEGTLTLDSKATGRCYKDQMRINFKDHIKFDVNPTHLMQIMEKASIVHVNSSIIKIDNPNCTYVAALIE